MKRYALWTIVAACFFGVSFIGQTIAFAEKQSPGSQDLQNLVAKLELPIAGLCKKPDGTVEYIFHQNGANPFEVSLSVRDGQLTRIILCGGRDSREETFKKTRKFLERVLQMAPFSVNDLLAQAIAESFISLWRSDEHYKYERCKKCESTSANREKCGNCRIIATDHCDAFGVKITTGITKKHYQIVIWPGKRTQI